MDGREFTLGIDKLSPEDQEYLKDWKPASATSFSGKKEDLTIGPPPSRLQLADFYKKHVDYDGLPIVSSEKVPDKALLEARKIVAMMVAKNPRMIDKLVKNKVRVAIMASTEMTTDIPEHSDLTPKDYWDKRARGVGATHARPATSGAEENLLNLPGDRYKGENIFLHEFAHTLHLMAMVDMDPGFDAKLKKTYEKAIAAGLWKGTYAASDYKEYFAEGVQSWFNANMESKIPNGIHNEINTHKELEKYDPELYALIAEWLPAP
ncbi:hypothetical protein [Brevifollis gellanilyticus]|uniref:Glycoside hydrolase n=1 Tax=Brevifollis gellanilyticus TaxID=748831 RepID=A0A512MBT4_9BACT|nr:hypothetical protein [Brevifollis gellanilyticus]GEP44189.1 hypothetical protein BGE01nite_34800 [Brevifollis gellanilyticus]